MSIYNVTIISGNDEFIIEVEHQTFILDALRHNNIKGITAPCGGARSCGKCIINIQGSVSPPEPEEIEHLGLDAIKKGFRLGCSAKITGPSVIKLLPQAEAKILTTAYIKKKNVNPALKLIDVKIQKSDINNQLDDLSRIISAINQTDSVLLTNEWAESIACIKDIGEFMRKGQDSGCFLTYKNNLIAYTKTNKSYGIAGDIGTTTVVLHLIDMHTGELINSVSAVNNQSVYGADVISRIKHANSIAAIKNETPLQACICGQIDEMITELCQHSGINYNEIHQLCFAGNTAMLHFLCGVSVHGMAVSPFTATFLKGITIENSILFSNAHPRGLTFLLPSVASYVGSDITAGILSSGLYKDEGYSLFIDLGTNGEIALGNKEQILTCSTAAGPAFEGANIACGIGGVAGAIFSVLSNENNIEWRTIDDAEPTGICGSGIIDCSAAILNMGIADYTGAFVQDKENEHWKSGVLVEKNGVPALKLTDDLYFSQKDIREVQLAKAAISAGIQTLMAVQGLSSDRITRVCVAGGFGNFVDIENALRIGLLDKQWSDKIESLGNTAGDGAIEVLLDADTQNTILEIIEKTKYLELSNSNIFNEKFYENMHFPSE